MNPEAHNLWQGDQVADAEAGSQSEVAQTTHADEQPISWQASEYILHEKDKLWFVGLLGVSLAFVALAIFLLSSWTFALLVVVMTASVAVYANRAPRVLNYSLGHTSLHINDKIHQLHEFRAFGILKEGAVYSIVLIPTKRFMPAVYLYFPQDQGEPIVDILGASVPMEQIKLDPVERLVRKLRF